MLWTVICIRANRPVFRRTSRKTDFRPRRCCPAFLFFYGARYNITRVRRLSEVLWKAKSLKTDQQKTAGRPPCSQWCRSSARHRAHARAGHYSAHAQFCPLKPVLQFFSSVTQKNSGLSRKGNFSGWQVWDSLLFIV